MTMLGLDIGRLGEPSVSTDLRVGTLQAFLVAEGFDLGEWGDNGDGVDGAAGDDTRRGFIAWKNREGLTGSKSAGEGKVGSYEDAALLRSGKGGGGLTQAAADKRYVRGGGLAITDV